MFPNNFVLELHSLSAKEDGDLKYLRRSFFFTDFVTSQVLGFNGLMTGMLEIKDGNFEW